MPVILYWGGRGRRIMTLRSAQAKIARSCLKNKVTAGCWWLTPVILAMEIEIRTIEVKCQLGQIKFVRTYLLNNRSKMDWKCGSSSRVPIYKHKALSLRHCPTKKKKVIIKKGLGLGLKW
jgi:hypothetical protein